MKLLFIIVASFIPNLAYAQPSDFSEVVEIISGLFDLATPFLGAVALFLFFWGLAKFMRGGGDEDAVKDGKKLMLWGVLGMFMIVSVWAVVRMLVLSFGFNIGIPQL